MRPLFSSIHCYLEPSSGAALCTRELLELLAARGMDCRVLTTGILDPERETSLDEVLAALELPVRRFQAELVRGGSAEAIDLRIYGVRVMLMPAPKEDAGRVRKGSGPQVMAVLRNLIIYLCSFSSKASLAAATRHYMGHPEKSVELVSTPI